LGHLRCNKSQVADNCGAKLTIVDVADDDEAKNNEANQTQPIGCEELCQPDGLNTMFRPKHGQSKCIYLVYCEKNSLDNNEGND
jgi:hypothetical protein